MFNKSFFRCKFILIKVLLVLLIFFSSCSKDDNNVDNPFIGSWEHNDISDVCDCVYTITYTFKSDMSMQEEHNYVNYQDPSENEYLEYECKYSYTSNEITITRLDSGGSFKYLYKINGNELTFTFEEETVTFTKN